MQGGKKHSPDSDRYKNISKQLAVFIGSTSVPLSLVENDSFKMFVQVLDSRCALPCRSKLGKEIDAILVSLKSVISSYLTQPTSVNICVDIWTKRGMTSSYLGITGHFYSNKDEIVFVHRNNESFNIAKLNIKTRDLEVLTTTQNDESPCIAPNGNVIIYSTKDGNLSYLAGVNISSKVKFRLPALYGELKEPAWSPFLR